ncbi:hypothetical protein ACM44_12225 [Chryseobacterium koreense CCUG 49689]|uniref:Uncharacterized protein n=2 Tax=Chryseobacterium koreense TaxID=232216 RepID=A0A0J7IXA8_9FLAO|nr:hypothetical protein ACM44_12225 [Chryseobacterium koreense CCUG 49689]
MKLKITLFIAAFFFSSISFAQKKFEGTFSNGYKGSKLSFILSADGKEIKDFTFQGYWRCGGSTEMITLGPEKKFPVTNNKINGIIVEPENGGASAIRFQLEGLINGKKASGIYRMSITGLSCDTYELKWTAAAK